MSKEFKRAQDLGELDLSIFTTVTQERIHLLIKDPTGYYQKYALFEGTSAPDTIRKLERELRDVKRSATFKVGKAVLCLPHAVRKKIRKRK